jgi:predicted ATPase/DNA-binding winged helix-turn-helix (wHTH) protein
MAQQYQLTFGPFRLETPQGGLWRGDQRLALRPRSLAMLRYLAAHPGRLVTKAEVQQHVWAGTHVSDTVLRVCVREIRMALGDAAVAPRYLVTVGHQGYRWLGGAELEGPPPRPASLLVGRQGEVAFLAEWGEQAAHGTRQLVFVSGEAGVGKTTVVAMYLARLAAGGEVRMVRGQCVEHTGEGEPYLPFLEALRQLGQGPERDTVRAVLQQYAPMWLVQLPGLVSAPELERLQSRLQGAMPARMLRELAEALEVLTADRFLVVLLEDLQWSDRSTVECLAYLAHRPAPARLLVLGTYRPVEALLQGHPLRGMVQEICGRGQGVDLRLEFLTAADVAAYLTGRLGGLVAASLTALVYARTDGNALFMVNIVEHLVQQGAVVRRAGQWALREEVEAQEAGLPAGLRGLLLRRIEALPPATRQVLEAASVAGETFTVAVVAAGVQGSMADVEDICARLAAQRYILDDAGWTVWPDATSGGRYRFQHALYQQVLYESLGTARRVQLHQAMGTRLEAGYGAQAGEMAAQLAVHFERAGAVQRAVHYWQQTGEQAGWRYAYPEALIALRKALALLATLPESPERDQHELMLQLSLGELLTIARGTAVPEVGEVYTRASTLCHQRGESLHHFQALQGLQRFHVTQAQLPAAGELAQQLTHLAHHQGETSRVLEGQAAIGVVALLRGDLVTGRALLEPYLSLSAPLPPVATTFHRVRHLSVAYLAWLMQALWELGYAAQAQQRHTELLALAQQLGHPPNLVYAQCFGAFLAQYCRDAATTYDRADAVTAFATAQGLEHNVVFGRILLGWALAMQGDAATGVAHIQAGLETVQRTGLKLYRPYFLALLAEASGQAGQPEAGLTALAEAMTLIAATEERWWEAEVYRLQGVLLLQLPIPDVGQAEACFQQALDVARRQQAKALELRAALSLARLWQEQGQRTAARQLLAEISGWFTEGFDTADLQAAQTVLAALEVSSRP